MPGGRVMAPPAPAVPAGECPSVAEKLWPPAPQSVHRARHFLAQHLDAWGLPHLTDSAQVIVSELLTNAVRYAHPPYGNVIATRFERLESGVRIEVHDAGDGKPERREASADEEDGRGLCLVDALTGGQWGVSDREGPGKIVWAEYSDSGDSAAEVAR
jgi:anti-sigma regulatory factor (Ser/Thr protein kinase)